MAEFFIFVVIFGLFLYTKNRVDGLRDEIIGLRAKLGIKDEVIPPVMPVEEPPQSEMNQTFEMPETAGITRKTSRRKFGIQDRQQGVHRCWRGGGDMRGWIFPALRV